MKKNIILTGGAGFIGSCFLWKLNQEGIYDIIVVDDLDATEKWRNLVGKKFLDYVQKDDFLKKINENKFNHISSIVHLGACSSTTLNDAGYFLRNNYEYTKSLAIWAIKKGARFVYASSAATYGNGEAGYDDSESMLHSLRPLNMYGYSKHLFDLWALDNGVINDMAGIKFFNVFGPNEYHKGDMMSVICKRFPDVRGRGSIRLFKSYRDEFRDGEQKRDFVYIKDAIDALYYLLMRPKFNGIFNLGSGSARSWNDLARAMFLALNKPVSIEYIEMPEEIRPKYQYFTEAKMDKLRKCGYENKFTPFEDAVRDYTGYLNEKKYL